MTGMGLSFRTQKLRAVLTSHNNSLSRYAQSRRGISMKTNNTTIEDRIQYFEKNYNILVDVNLVGDKSHTIRIDGLRKCRFCERNEGEVTFKKEAHAFSELIGNRTLLTNYECDSCNEHFSKYLENHLANYLGPARTFTLTKGKTGVPSYKTADESSRVDVKSGEIVVQTMADQPMFVEDEKNKLITFHATKPTYVPVAVYKTLVKMALSILPENEMDAFKTTAKWLLSTDHSKVFMRPCPMNFSFTNGLKPHPFIKAMVFKVKDLSLDVPFMQFFIAFDNFTFQITIPTEQDLRLQGKTATIQAFPSIHEVSDTENETKHALADMSDWNPVKGSKVEVQLAYEKKRCPNSNPGATAHNSRYVMRHFCPS
ncbi:MAG: hypothetical protein JNM27_13780 [Leptospirales bacterium]|nr:hypothetical protein [Leptospirales bacterium]